MFRCRNACPDRDGTGADRDHNGRGSRFTAPAGTPSQMLSLPYNKIGQATTYLQATQPIQALSGTVAPWFGQIGGGTQYLLLDGRVDQLIAEGILKILGE